MAVRFRRINRRGMTRIELRRLATYVQRTTNAWEGVKREWERLERITSQEWTFACEHGQASVSYNKWNNHTETRETVGAARRFGDERLTNGSKLTHNPTWIRRADVSWCMAETLTVFFSPFFVFRESFLAVDLTLVMDVWRNYTVQSQDGIISERGWQSFSISNGSGRWHSTRPTFHRRCKDTIQVGHKRSVLMFSCSFLGFLWLITVCLPLKEKKQRRWLAK